MFSIFNILFAVSLGVGPEQVFFEFDSDRPGVGIHYYPCRDKERDLGHLRRLKKRVDFVQIDLFATSELAPPDQTRHYKRSAYNFEIIEAAKIPWSGTIHGLLEWGVPAWFSRDYPDEIESGFEGKPSGRRTMPSVSKYAEHAWALQERAIQTAIKNWGDSPHLIGWNSGSEPHVFGWWDDLDPLGYSGFAPPTMSEFREWLQESFGDASPDEDTNQDGVTLNSRCGSQFLSWSDVTPKSVVENSQLRTLHDRFLAQLSESYVRHTAELFRLHDPRRVTISRLLSLTDKSHFYRDSLTSFLHPEVIGFTGYPTQLTKIDAPQRGFDVFLDFVEILGDKRASLFLHPPFTGKGAAWAEFRIDIPDDPDAVLDFWTGQAATPDSESDGIRFRVFVGNRRMFEYYHRTHGWKRHAVPLDRWSGKQVRIRLETDAGPNHDSRSDWAHWGSPTIRASNKILDLLSFHGSAKAGVRTSAGRTRPIALPVREFDPIANDFAFAVIAGCARFSGKRMAFVETHPTIVTPAINQWALMHQVFRSCAFKPAVITFFCYYADQSRTHPVHDLAPYSGLLARVRNLLALLRPYRAIQRTPRYALFLPEFIPPSQFSKHDPRAVNRPLMEAAVRMGMNVYALGDIEQGKNYEGIVILLGTHDRLVGNRVAQFLRSGYDGRVVILQSEKPLRGFPSVSPGLLSFVREARELWQQSVQRFGANEQVRVFTSDKNWIYVFGMPATGLDRVIEDSFEKFPSSLSHGRFYVCNKPERIRTNGLYLIETVGIWQLATGLMAYDYLNNRPAKRLKGPGLFHVFSPDQNRLLDTGMLYLGARNPDHLGAISGGSEPPNDADLWMLELNGDAENRDDNAIVLWTKAIPHIKIAGNDVEVEYLGDGFYRAFIPVEDAVQCEVRLSGH